MISVKLSTVSFISLMLLIEDLVSSKNLFKMRRRKKKS
jgi:hypothetical protein